MLIFPISSQNDYKWQLKFKGSAIVTPQEAHVAADTFVKTAKDLSFYTIKNIYNYLKINESIINNGQIFNTPVTKDGDSLLCSLVRIKPTPDEELEYESLIFKMSQMKDIDYDQKDSTDVSVKEWILTSENEKLFSLIENKNLEWDSMLMKAFDRIKNPEFKERVINSEFYSKSFDLEPLKKQFDNYYDNNKDFTGIFEEINKLNFDSPAYEKKSAEFAKLLKPLVTDYLRNDQIKHLLTDLKGNKKVFKDVVCCYSTGHRHSPWLEDGYFVIPIKNIYRDSPNNMLDILSSGGLTAKDYNPVVMERLFDTINLDKVDREKFLAFFAGEWQNNSLDSGFHTPGEMDRAYQNYFDTRIRIEQYDRKCCLEYI